MLAGSILLPSLTILITGSPHSLNSSIGTVGRTIVFATKNARGPLLFRLSGLYPCCNTALFATTHLEIAGTVDAIFTCALQLGSAAGAAIVTSISIQTTRPSERISRSCRTLVLIRFHRHRDSGCADLYYEYRAAREAGAGA